ncbi:MAG: TfoX/Sxy family protein [Phycisphaerae bacterium]|nr:TfoX/Sxy family protein [Phycisphaerae bacterium]
MAKNESLLSPAAIAHYDRIIATVPGVKRKGAKAAYTSRNGHMFSFLMPEGPLALRLPDDARAAFEKKHKTGPCIQYGCVMRGYVVVPDTLFRRTAAVAKLFRLSYDHIGSLPPKPTTKSKKTTKPKTKKKASTKEKVASKKKVAATKKATAKKRATISKKTTRRNRKTTQRRDR